MDRSSYKLEWFLVVVHGYIVSVCGSALRDMADELAVKHDGAVVWVGSYGMTYHCGQRLE